MKSLGCVDYGNNNFYELMQNESSNELFFVSHDDEDDITGYDEFLAELEPNHLIEVNDQLKDLLP